MSKAHCIYSIETFFLAKLLSINSHSFNCPLAFHDSISAHNFVIIPLVNTLRKVVFPNGRRWEKETTELYSRLKDMVTFLARRIRLPSGCAPLFTTKESSHPRPTSSDPPSSPAKA